MSPAIRTVSSYYTHDEYCVDFFGNELIVTVTPTASVINRWISNVQYLYYGSYSSHPPVVGVGVQWTPIFYHSNSQPYRYNPLLDYIGSPPSRYYGDSQPDTLQLCVGNRCLIIQLSHCDYIPNDLRSFLTDQETTYVGVWNSQDARKLAQSTHRLVINNLVDIRIYLQDSQGRSLRSRSFEHIVEECMGYQGVRLDPEISVSDWSAYNLCHEQILQASIDAFVSSELAVWVRLWEFS